MNHWKHVFGGALLVAGTSIGAGMLALPIATGMGGFFPSLAVFLLVWMVLTATGLLFLEICLSLPDETNIISMSQKYLGRKGKLFAWFVYLFLFYTLSVAYLSKGGELVHLVLGKYLSTSMSVTLMLVVLGACVWIGTRAVDRINVILMIGLGVSFLAFVVLGISDVQLTNLTYVDSPSALLAMPVILISFGYQGIVPSLTSYLNRDPKKVRLAIILGTTMSLLVYLLWEFLILGIIPAEGATGLIEAKLQGQTAVAPLKNIIKAQNIYAIGQFFSFFAVTTSFLGVTLGLFDFLADGLNIHKRTFSKKALIAALTFIPPFIIALTYPGVFLRALQYAGGIGGNLLLVFLPALLAWKARYSKQAISSSERQLFGGKTVLICVFLFSIASLVIEVVNEIFG